MKGRTIKVGIKEKFTADPAKRQDLRRVLGKGFASRKEL
jgi:hypothetical protein